MSAEASSGGPARAAGSDAARGSVDDLASRLARLLAVRLVVLTLFLAFVTLVYLRGQTGGFSSLVLFVTVAIAYGVSALYATLVRRRRLLVAAGYAQIVTDQIAWTAIVYVSGGVTSGGVSLFGLTCLAGAIALGARGAFVALLSAGACYSALAALLIHRVLPIPPDQSPSLYAMSWEVVLYPMLANFCGLLVVASMSGYLAERLRRAGGDLARAEARAQRAEQLAALGQIATGLAHEIRNPLGGIAGSIELLAGNPTLSEEDRQLCLIVQREAARINDLVTDMLDLSRPRPPLIGELDLVEVARDVVTLASTSGRGGDVVVNLDAPSELRVCADPAQLRQLTWNLVRNAVQASSAGDEVAVRIRRSGAGAEMVVEDHGKGIDPEAASRLFDAFFTTRSQGTGVGLAVVKRIVDAHGFHIRVESEEGARFIVSFPPAAVVSEHDHDAREARSPGENAVEALAGTAALGE